MTVFNGMSNESVLTSDSRCLASGPQWKSFVRYRLGGSQDWQPPLSWYQRALERAGLTQCQGLPRRADTRHFYPHENVHNIHFHSFVISGLSVFHLCVCDLIFLPVQMRACCMFICTFSSYHVSHSSYAGTFSSFVNILFLFQAPALSDGFICVDLSSLRHRLWAVVCVCSFQRPACSLMSVWLTSSLAQISIKAPADEAAADGCSVLGCLVCLRGSVKYMLIRKKGMPVLPSRVDAALCSL